MDRSGWSRSWSWRVVAVIAAAAVVMGVVLVWRPFESLNTLVTLVALALGASGLGELVTATFSSRPALGWLTAAIWVAAAIVLLAWRDIEIWPLAIVVAAALAAGGVAKVAVAVLGEGDERWLLGVSGITSVAVGVLAVGWPDVTVLVLAVAVGIVTLVDGLGLAALAWRLRSGTITATGTSIWPRRVRVVGTLAAFVLAAAGAIVSVALHRAQPGEPGAFYTAPSPLPDGPLGTIIRQEVVDGYIDGSTTYRILYVSTGFDGAPAAVSGMIVVPDGAAPAEGRKVLAYTHGTVGVAPRCAPSLQSAEHNPLLFEGARMYLDAGYVIAATDYEGLGTKGPHPYVIGEPEAMNALDSVRAARNLTEASAGSDFAVWGHSQGGHASAFTGQLAASYAPELRLVGVAAGAPVPDLVDLFKVNIDTQIGKVLVSMAIQMWSQVYDDASVEQIVTPSARPLVAKIARNCLYSQGQILGSVPAALALDLSFVSAPLWEVEPWKTIAADNTPGGSAVGVPMLIVQSETDGIIPADVTARYVDRLCASGENVERLELTGISHLETGHEAAADVFRWIEDRFTGVEPATGCG